MPENNWRVTEQFTVAFLPHGADSARGWQSVTVHYGNIDALRAIPAFSNATLTQASGVYCLTLSDTPESLPTRSTGPAGGPDAASVRQKTLPGEVLAAAG